METISNIGAVITEKSRDFSDWVFDTSWTQKARDLREFERHEFPWPLMMLVGLIVTMLVAIRF